MTDRLPASKTEPEPDARGETATTVQTVDRPITPTKVHPASIANLKRAWTAPGGDNPAPRGGRIHGNGLPPGEWIARLLRAEVSRDDMRAMLADKRTSVSKCIAIRRLLQAEGDSERSDRAAEALMDRIEGRAVQRVQTQQVAPPPQDELVRRLAAIVAENPALAAAMRDSLALPDPGAPPSGTGDGKTSPAPHSDE